MLDDAKKRSGMDIMIDQATGFEKNQLEEATKLHTEIRQLIEEYSNL